VAENLARKLVADHLVAGEPEPGEEIALRIDQILTHDANGPLCALQLDAMGVAEPCTQTAVAYVDHLLVESDSRNADDHVLLDSAARRFGMWFSRAGNGVSHPVHQQRFGVPGASLLGTDSHTPAAGALGMLAIGAGGLAISLALAGEPFRVAMPEVWGIRLVGEPPDWVSAKDVILEMLRRHGVSGAAGRIIEYHGPGVAALSVMDRHVIANMGTELGATTSVFPSEDETRRYLAAQGREEDWRPLAADEGAGYDHADELDLSALEPLIALPSSPGNVVPVREVAGQEVFQCYIGSSANPGYRDIAVAAEMLDGRRIADGVALEINPASRQALEQLIAAGHVTRLVHAGARLHQTGCNGCIGMGQAPATGRRSLRTVPRNFPGRSGGREDQVYLCSPETAAASALTGVITDPRTIGRRCPRITEPDAPGRDHGLLRAPPPPEAPRAELAKGPGHADLPEFEPIGDEVELPVLLDLGDDVSTDEIMPAGASAMSLWSNVPAMSEHSFLPLDESYVDKARELVDRGGHAVVAGRNYGQGSSREQAALAPRYLGLRLVLAVSIARIHAENLANYGVLPLTFADPEDRGRVEAGGVLRLSGLHEALASGRRELTVEVGGEPVPVRHTLSPRQVELVLAGGCITWMRGSHGGRVGRSASTR
jgi:aconitate hydratase